MGSPLFLRMSVRFDVGSPGLDLGKLNLRLRLEAGVATGSSPPTAASTVGEPSNPAPFTTG